MINEFLRDDVKDIVPHQYTILADFITLPQLVIYWYVATAMPEHTLAIIPHGGYDKRKCGSLKENIWLAYLDTVHERDEGVNFVPIRSHYCTSGLQKRDHLESFCTLTDSRRECYEFYGFYYFGCMSCYPDHSHLVRKQVREDGYHSIQAAFDSTMEHKRNIKALLKFEHGFDKWIELWEHEFNSNVTWYKEALGPDVINDMANTLNPKNLVKGGRTEVFQMYCHVDELTTQCIRYLDVNSLYPYVMSKITFPVGHPEIRCSHTSCKNLMDKLNKQGKNLLGFVK